MIQQPAGSPLQVYYKRQTFFTVIVSIWSINVILNFAALLILSLYSLNDIIMLALSAFVIAWNFNILISKKFFFSGDLTIKCSPWLIIAGGHFVIASRAAPTEALIYLLAGIFDIIIFLCYRYWSFFRPWKQVQHMPTYTVQNPNILASPIMMQQPYIMQQPPMMQPSPVMMWQNSHP